MTTKATVQSLSKKHGFPAQVNFPLTMAPMVGLSHCAFRALVRDYLPAEAQTLWPSEMLNSRRIPGEVLSRLPEAMTAGDESFWMPQILANDEEKIRLSLPKLFAHGAQGIDINMGCPVQKALKHNYGVALMGDSDYAAEVVRMTVRHAEGKPVSVKLRGTSLDKRGEWLRFCEGLERAGASWLCLHPRTPEQKRRGRADWSAIRELDQNSSRPIIGNGDIQTLEDVLMMLDETGCAMVMAGRALTARPWLFWQVGEALGWSAPIAHPGERAPQTPEEEGAEYGRSLLRLWHMMLEFFPRPLAQRKFLFHVRTGAVWLQFGHHLHAQLTAIKDPDHIPEVLQAFFSQPQKMVGRTELRQ